MDFEDFGLNPGQVAHLDQELAETRRVLASAVRQVGEFRSQAGDDDRGKLFVNLVREFHGLDHLKSVVLLVEALLQFTDSNA